MANDQDLWEDLVALVRERPDRDDFLARLPALVIGSCDAVTASSITAWRDGEAVTVAMTSPLATYGDEVQYGLDDGPCLRCLRTGRATSLRSTAADHRWPEFATRARAQGVRSVASFPLVVRGETVAALNVYAEEPEVLVPSVEDHLSALAARAAGCLALLTAP